MSGIREFTKKYLVTIVMVPSIVLMHMGWMKLQEVPAFVRPDEKKDYPFMSIFHKLHKKLRGVEEEEEVKK